MPFPPDVKEDALVSCGRCCCICHKFCGIKIEVHHIHEESEGGNNALDNSIALCFDCHADMRSYDFLHPKGNKYSESELKRHRDNWHEKIKGNIGVADRELVVETDKQVYKVLIKVLPWEGSINFIRTNNFAGFSFKIDELKDLYKFEYICKNPSFEFIDPDLEVLRVNLLKLIDDFTYVISTQTFPIPKSDRNGIPKEWELDQPEHFHKIVNELNSLEDRIIDTYSSLMRTSTRKLGLLPLEIA
jgi:hypothetical protein